jgi:formylglycine-generating enzyme required for sulfatase activity
MLSALLLAVGMTRRTLAETPGEETVIVFQEFPDVKLRLHYCPSGTIFPGRPVVNEAGSEVQPLPVRDFYIGETEVTIGQLRAVLGQAGMQNLTASARRLSSNPELLQLAQSGHDEPTFLAGLEEAVDFCQALQSAFDRERATTAQTAIETRTFRLPSHVEWQYAARAVQSAVDQGQRPHFGRWVRFDELPPATQEKCREIWKALGQQTDFPGDQNAFFQLSGAPEGERGKVSEVLSEAFQKAFGSPARSAAGTGQLTYAGTSNANDWGLREMHEGVPEWTIWARDRERLTTLWKRMADERREGRSLDGQEDVFLSGGSFADSYFGANALARFTIWGGPKLTDGQAIQFEYQRAAQVEEYLPGFRIVLERALDNEWLFLVRKGVFQKEAIQPNAEIFVADNIRLAPELVDDKHPVHNVLSLYAVLAAGNSASSTALSKQLAQIAQNVPSSSSADAPKPNRLLAIVKRPDNPNTATERTTESDDQIFFRLLSSLTARTQL